MQKSRREDPKAKSDGFLARYGAKPDGLGRDVKRGKLATISPPPPLPNPLFPLLYFSLSKLSPHPTATAQFSIQLSRFFRTPNDAAAQQQQSSSAAVRGSRGLLPSIKVGLRACWERDARARWRRQAVCRTPVVLLCYPWYYQHQLILEMRGKKSLAYYRVATTAATGPAAVSAACCCSYSCCATSLCVICSCLPKYRR